ncbi:MAG: MFS transporter [Treponema sp.]|nr:MFS transporter [Treponema sp.]
MKSWRSNYTAILIAQTLAIMGFGFSFPIIPFFLEEDIGLTDPARLKFWVGLIHASAAITLAIFAPIWGHLSDVFSRKLMLLRATFCGAIVIGLMSLTTAPWQLLVLRTLQGCLTGTVAASTVLVASISPAAQIAFTLGLLQTGIAVGSSLGPLVGGVISDFLGYRAAFVGTSILMAIASLIVLKFVHDDFQSSPERKLKKFSLFPDFKIISGSSILVKMMIVTLVVQAALSVAAPMIPLYIKELAERAGEEILMLGSATGMVMGIGAASSALAAVLVGKFAGRIGFHKSLIFCLSLGAVLTIPQAFAVNLFQLTVYRALSAFFLGGSMPLINAILAVSSNKQQQGTVFGINTSVASAGAALGPMLGSFVAILDLRAIFWVSALILGLSVITLFRGAQVQKQENYSEE